MNINNKWISTIHSFILDIILSKTKLNTDINNITNKYNEQYIEDTLSKWSLRKWNI